MQAKEKKCEKKQRGAIIVEATIALTTFIFAMFTIYSLVNICYVQSKMAVAVNSAAKEMSQYAYLYTTFGLDKHMSGSGGKSSEMMDSFSVVLSKISDGSAVFSDDISEMFSDASKTASGDSGSELIKDLVGMGLAKKLVEKNLVAYEGDTADAFLRRNNVVDGLDGLNFVYTSFLADEDQDEIDVVVSYKVKVIELLNIDYEFSFVQRATTKAWTHADIASGDSGSDNDDKEEGPTIWETGPLSRGEKIIETEKEKYEYTSDKNGFHAYNSEKNEFIKIRSINTYDDTYSDPEKGQKQIKYQLQSSFSSMYDKVSELDETITVKNSSGQDTTFTSDPETRIYKIVLVVPDDADMETINAAIKEFEKEKAANGQTVTVEVRTGYGNHSSEKTAASEE